MNLKRFGTVLGLSAVLSGIPSASNVAYFGVLNPGRYFLSGSEDAATVDYNSKYNYVKLITGENPELEITVPDSPRGYSLSRLAEETNEEFGIKLTWQDLFRENRQIIGENPDLIHPGQVFTYPLSDELERKAIDSVIEWTPIRWNARLFGGNL